MDKFKGMMWGALAGSFIASTLAFLRSRETLLNKMLTQSNAWADKARNVKENLYDDLHNLTESRRNRFRKTFARGAFLGLLLGIGSTALLTPKTGKQLRKDLTQGYRGVANKTQDIVHFIHQNGYRRPLRKFAKSLSRRRAATKMRARTRN